MLAAALALVWNLASLVVLGARSPTVRSPNITATIGFSVLSLLPAVLFDLCLPDRYRVLVRLGYGLSAVRLCCTSRSCFAKARDYHRWGLALITIGYGALTCIAAAGIFASRDQGTAAPPPRAWSAPCRCSCWRCRFVHLRSAHATQVWSRELAFHHAAIPLALLVLLAGLPLRSAGRVPALSGERLLAALFIFGAVEAWRMDLLPRPATPFHQALLLTGAVPAADPVRDAARRCANRC